ncbi:hypothetical protein [Nonomuraea sp. NPDC049784]|uniref:hypothetical protein n=1 Tax=Nonomuraea sp. NPDC049784 TaxID=3154361 RepID=UPI0033DE4049
MGTSDPGDARAIAQGSMSGLTDIKHAQFAVVLQTIRAAGSGLEGSREGQERADRL